MKNLLKITFCGDIMCHKDQSRAAMSKYGKYDYSGYLSGISHLFVDSDYVIANLETPLLPAPFVEEKMGSMGSQFSTPETILDEIKGTGINFISTSNNHCLDRGVEGIRDTINLLDEAGFDHSGTYISKENKKGFFIKEIDGVKIAIVCMTYGTNSRLNGVMLNDNDYWIVNLTRKQEKQLKLKFDPKSKDHSVERYIPDDVSPAAIDNAKNQELFDTILEYVRNAKKIADIVLVYPHIGGQYNPAPGLYTRYIVNALKEAGADIIIANHPHTPLRCEKQDNGIICAWALGNLAFTPGAGFYMPNTLAEYSIIMHTFWTKDTHILQKITFNVTKSMVDDNGFSYVKEVSELYSSLTNKTEKERLIVDNEAVVNRFSGQTKSIIPQKEYEFYI